MANVLVVGANQGIGYYLVERLLELGNTVTVLDIQIHAIEILKEKYQKTLLPVIADAQSLSGIENGVLQAIRKFGDIDIAIHNACLCTFESERDTNFEIYQNVMDINYFGALRLTKSVLPHMRKAKKGRIIFTSSGVGVTGFANISPYADTKSASGISVPKEFMAKAKEVGYGLANRIWLKRFVICHSAIQTAQMKFSYRHPLFIGKMMTRASKRTIGSEKGEGAQ